MISIRETLLFPRALEPIPSLTNLWSPLPSFLSFFFNCLFSARTHIYLFLFLFLEIKYTQLLSLIENLRLIVLWCWLFFICFMVFFRKLTATCLWSINQTLLVLLTKQQRSSTRLKRNSVISVLVLQFPLLLVCSLFLNSLICL